MKPILRRFFKQMSWLQLWAGSFLYHQVQALAFCKKQFEKGLIGRHEHATVWGRV